MGFVLSIFEQDSASTTPPTGGNGSNGNGSNGNGSNGGGGNGYNEMFPEKIAGCMRQNYTEDGVPYESTNYQENSQGQPVTPNGNVIEVSATHGPLVCSGVPVQMSADIKDMKKDFDFKGSSYENNCSSSIRTVFNFSGKAQGVPQVTIA